MEDQTLRSVILEDLEDIAPGLHQTQTALMRSSCTVSLAVHGHVTGVPLPARITGEDCDVRLLWTDGVAPEEFHKFGDVSRRVDWGVQAIAILLVHHLMGYQVVDQSRTGNGFDYFLSSVGTDPDLPFNDTVRLEVSGIHAETPGNTLQQRASRKIKRLDAFASADPQGFDDVAVVVCVVDFANPRALAVMR